MISCNQRKLTKELIPDEKPKKKKNQKELFEIPSKYKKGLTKEQAKKKTENIKKTKELLKQNKKKEAQELAKKRPTTKDNKKSSYTIRFNKKFPNVKTQTKEFEKATGISLSIQNKIVKRGEGAFLSSGSRASVSSPTQWGRGRLLAFYFKLLDNKLDFDKDLEKKVKLKR
jgi:predicted acyl esterase